MFRCGTIGEPGGGLKVAARGAERCICTPAAAEVPAEIGRLP